MSFLILFKYTYISHITYFTLFNKWNMHLQQGCAYPSALEYTSVRKIDAICIGSVTSFYRHLKCIAAARECICGCNETKSDGEGFARHCEKDKFCESDDPSRQRRNRLLKPMIFLRLVFIVAYSPIIAHSAHPVQRHKGPSGRKEGTEKGAKLGEKKTSPQTVLNASSKKLHVI